MWREKKNIQSRGQITDDGPDIHDSYMFALSMLCQDDMICGRDTWSKQTSRHFSHSTVFLCVSSPLPPVAITSSPFSFYSHTHTHQKPCSSVAKKIKQIMSPSLFIICSSSSFEFAFVVSSQMLQPCVEFWMYCRQHISQYPARCVINVLFQSIFHYLASDT